jgi:hypothetical protein
MNFSTPSTLALCPPPFNMLFKRFPGTALRPTRFTAGIVSPLLEPSVLASTLISVVAPAQQLCTMSDGGIIAESNCWPVQSKTQQRR